MNEMNNFNMNLLRGSDALGRAAEEDSVQKMEVDFVRRPDLRRGCQG